MNRTRLIARILLAAYIIALTLIAFWPVPVDRGAGRLLRFITSLIPALTHSRIEVLANVVLFLPLGVLLAIILSRSRYLVLPIALLATVTIEGGQHFFLGERTSSLYDILANTTGACLGLVCVAIAEPLLRRYREYTAIPDFGRPHPHP